MIRKWIAAGVACAMATAGFVAATPGPAQAAAIRRMAWSAGDANPAKTVTATCQPGEVLLGAGAFIRSIAGGVRLHAVRPRGNSVEVRATAVPGYPLPWSVAAAALCAEPEPDLAPVLVASPPGSTTATCPEGRYVSGTGFDLPDQQVLTGLVTSTDTRSVSVWSPPAVIKTPPPVAYAICVWRTYREDTIASAVDTERAKEVEIDYGYDVNATGVSGWVTASLGGDPIMDSSSVFIYSLMPDGVSKATVRAARAWTSGAAPGSRSRSAGGDGEPWAVVAGLLSHDVYLAAA